MDPDLKDKVVFITGAARGMGRTYVEGFLDDGAKVVATDVSWEPTGKSHDGAPEFSTHRHTACVAGLRHASLEVGLGEFPACEESHPNARPRGREDFARPQRIE